MTAERPKLFIVGAGPGDPELITLKAYRVLKKARYILHMVVCQHKFSRNQGE